MAATESKMISLGSEAPDFSLSNGIDNKFYSLSDLKGKTYGLNEIKFIKVITTKTVKDSERTYYLYVGEIK